MRVPPRTQNYHGPTQTISGSLLTASSYTGKVFVKNEFEGEQTFEMMIRWKHNDDGSQSWEQAGSLVQSNTDWAELKFSFDNSGRNFADYDATFYVQTQNPSQSYLIDEIYLVDANDLYPPRVDYLRDGDFEMSEFYSASGPWSGFDFYKFLSLTNN